ncbi:MAG: hypothetical protein ACXVBW_13760, partial [Bdellovibrionota bacterium]
FSNPLASLFTTGYNTYTASGSIQLMDEGMSDSPGSPTVVSGGTVTIPASSAINGQYSVGGLALPTGPHRYTVLLNASAATLYNNMSCVAVDAQ